MSGSLAGARAPESTVLGGWASRGASKERRRMSTTKIKRPPSEEMSRRARRRCARCGVSFRLVLIRHHKDRNRRNNARTNIEDLCANCHMIEHRTQGGRRLPRALNVPRFPTKTEFLSLLGMTEGAFSRAVKSGILPPPTSRIGGTQSVYTREHLEECLVRWARFKEITDHAPGAPA
jgi:hypothetical protein